MMAAGVHRDEATDVLRAPTPEDAQPELSTTSTSTSTATSTVN